ncbi:hypothetical protein SNOG_04480 [Parastagonospora nodorum SN15]|uniref:Uncharacterized protein n=1 Tax=Phaeosphaeria nodorum (strain SN15 / ATCC MYA-4574 / FGSC 10173) TaxID=321614 RepID=Q0UUT4_PHANO|nr:hypothetical protein SNOG_04480 [Parastagonospora nodorum SN15]EAT88240.1 hypothetical protein SNOG_04480 [Parastagonospora nodorum SN15]
MNPLAAQIVQPTSSHVMRAIAQYNRESARFPTILAASRAQKQDLEYALLVDEIKPSKSSYTRTSKKVYIRNSQNVLTHVALILPQWLFGCSLALLQTWHQTYFEPRILPFTANSFHVPTLYRLECFFSTFERWQLSAIASVQLNFQTHDTGIYRDRETERIHLYPRLVSGLRRLARIDGLKRVAINWRRDVLDLLNSWDLKQDLIVNCTNAINRNDVDVSFDVELD